MAVTLFPKYFDFLGTLVVGAHAYCDRLGKRLGHGVSEPGRGRVSPQGSGHAIWQFYHRITERTRGTPR